MKRDRVASYPYIRIRAVGQSSANNFSGQKMLAGSVVFPLVHEAT